MGMMGIEMERMGMWMEIVMMGMTEMMGKTVHLVFDRPSSR